jgi:hypothetical protein
VFEVKPQIDAANIAYAGAKAASVRKLSRTSAPIRHAGGKFDPIEPPRIFAGILALESSWNPAFDEPFVGAIRKLGDTERLELGCALQCGGFEISYKDSIPSIQVGKPDAALIFFFLKLLARLQASGTVAALDFDIYSRVL